MGVIKHEMELAGLESEIKVFGRLATGAFCTLNSDITGWVCPEFAAHEVVYGSNDDRAVITLQDMARVVLPHQVAMWNDCHHPEAGLASRITWLMVRILLRAAAAVHAATKA